jgi:hypothetical protein
MRKCVIRQNACVGSPFKQGGGVFLSGRGRLEDCVIEQNVAGTGGGVSAQGQSGEGNPALVRCTIRSNDCSTGSGDGGGIFVSSQPGGYPALIEECIVVGNRAKRGGGIAASFWEVVLVDTTVSGNTATVAGGGVGLVQNWVNVTAANLVVWGNASPLGAQFSVDSAAGLTPQLAVAYSDVQGGFGAFGYENLGSPALVLYGAGNIDVDPRFVDADGPDNNPTTWADNDLHLKLSSPCIDAANNAAVYADLFDLDGDGNVSEPTPFDRDGVSRFVEIPSVPNTGAGIAPIVDMGCYERQP